MKTYSQRHNADQAIVSALKRIGVENMNGMKHIFVIRSDNRIHPVLYLDPNQIEYKKCLEIENHISNSGFTVMIGDLPPDEITE